jgi:hypothetical protein
MDFSGLIMIFGFPHVFFRPRKTSGSSLPKGVKEGNLRKKNLLL